MGNGRPFGRPFISTVVNLSVIFMWPDFRYLSNSSMKLIKAGVVHEYQGS
jgi:hypothetical protein